VGCGRRYTYVEWCDDVGERPQCTWLLDHPPVRPDPAGRTQPGGTPACTVALGATAPAGTHMLVCRLVPVTTPAAPSAPAHTAPPSPPQPLPSSTPPPPAARPAAEDPFEGRY
jgi:hypothetical protein